MSIFQGPIKDAGAEATQVGEQLMAAGVADLTTLAAELLDKADDYEIVFKVSLQRKVPVGPIEPGK